MYTKNIAGPRTDPWGTPDVTGRLSDSAPSTTTDCVLPLRKHLIHSSVVESMPYSCSVPLPRQAFGIKYNDQAYEELWS